MKEPIKEFIRDIIYEKFPTIWDTLYNKSELIQYLNSKTGAIYGNSKTRRSLANIYAIYSILYFYKIDFYGKSKENYLSFVGYEYTKLFSFYRGLYGGEKLQNHALNSRVNGEFSNKFDNQLNLIVIENGKYFLHPNYLFVDGIDISILAKEIIEKYIELLKTKDNELIDLLKTFKNLNSINAKREVILELLTEVAEARIFEIISYAILKNFYKNQKIFIGYSKELLEEQYLKLYKTGRTNANDGGIDFVMKPLGRFFQVTEVDSYDKYLLDIDKVLHFPITFVIKTLKNKQEIEKELNNFIESKTGGLKVVKERYYNSIEEIITINELKRAINNFDIILLNDVITDIDSFYRLEFNLL